MNKYFAILLLALLTMSGKSFAAEDWQCWKSIYKNSGPPLVRLQQSDDKNTGSVEVFGESYTARVGIEGLTKRWDFGESLNYSFVVSPDGSAAYYDFSLNKAAIPRMVFHCALVRPSAEQHPNVGTELSTDENRNRLNSLQEAYKLAIYQKVRRNWIRPAGSEKVPECWVRVHQGQGGIILDVTFGTCKGSTASYRASIENAFYKAEPLPKSADPSLFERELNFNFSAE